MPDDPQAALLSAATTEHFVMQTAAASTITEASARSTLYVMALSSSLVALGFTAHEGQVPVPFALAVLSLVFVLGLFTVMRLVDTSLESMMYLHGIARIRAHYRTLGPQAEALFSKENGRWPEIVSPALKLGPLAAHLGTTAAMIAVLNNAVAGIVVALLVHLRLDSWAIPIGAGLAIAIALSVAFVAYQAWRMNKLPNHQGEQP